jgi:UDP-N-acetylglucosamine 4,6-dehydratase/5-epimerase
MRRKYSDAHDGHPIQVVGTRPGEKIHEVLVNEYEIERATEDPAFITIHPEYRRPVATVERPLGYEYTSANTTQITEEGALSDLLDEASAVDEYV